MNKIFLFSPLGGTDPISQNNYKDGSMLHICRFERPDKIFLYLSKEMVGYEKEDHRYTYCLDKLMELQGRKFEYVLDEHPELVDVYDYDYFYREFSSAINKIMQEEMDETDTLILNISSGTPAMKSALAVMQTISEYPCRLIQVTTPNKAMNKHDISGYDPVLLWDYNEDNQPDAENRCIDVSLPTLSLMKKEEIIKMHIRACDYRAALQVAETMPVRVTEKYIDLIRMAAARLQFDLNTVLKLETKTGLRCLPIRSGDAIRRFEYALNLQIKLEKQEYADFIRAITPIIVDLFEQVLNEKCSFNVDDFCRPANKAKNIPRKWDIFRFEASEIGLKALQALDNEYASKGFTPGPVYSDHLKVIIDAFSTDDGLKKVVGELRGVEANIRNLAAHELESFTEQKILDMTGQPAKSIMQDIKALFVYAGYKIPKDAWNSYKEMNNLIIDCIQNG